MEDEVGTSEFISIPEWARRLEISKDSAYKAARLGQIPGCFAIGRLYRVNWGAFVEQSANRADPAAEGLKGPRSDDGAKIRVA